MFRPKNLLVLMLVVGIVGGVAYALTAGHLVGGLSIEPVVNAGVGVAIGYCFEPEPWQLMIGKTAPLNTWQGDWTFGVLWVPRYGGLFHVRVGPEIVLRARPTGLTFRDLAFQLGGMWKWTLFTLYADVRITSAFGIIPEVGVEINFQLPQPPPAQYRGP